MAGYKAQQLRSFNAQTQLNEILAKTESMQVTFQINLK
jgi:hypothetical protein